MCVCVCVYVCVTLYVCVCVRESTSERSRVGYRHIGACACAFYMSSLIVSIVHAPVLRCCEKFPAFLGNWVRYHELFHRFY
jgi:hypothetical protein